MCVEGKKRTINFLVLKGFPLVKTQCARLSALVPINNKISPQPELFLSRDFVGLNPVFDIVPFVDCVQC